MQTGPPIHYAINNVYVCASTKGNILENYKQNNYIDEKRQYLYGYFTQFTLASNYATRGRGRPSTIDYRLVVQVLP